MTLLSPLFGERLRAARTQSDLILLKVQFLQELVACLDVPSPEPPPPAADVPPPLAPAEEVSRIEGYHHEEPQDTFKSPLFGKRGLFATPV